MIRINLLPVDKRRPERTPRPRFLLILSNVIVVCLIAVYLAWFFVIKLPQINTRVTVANDTLNKLKGDVAEHTKLTAEMKKIGGKVKQIQSVTGRKVDLWRTMDSVWNIVQKNPRIWLSRISFLGPKEIQAAFKKTNPRGRTFPEFGLLIECHASSDNASAMTAFRRGLRDEPFLEKHFTVMNNNPEWSVSTEDGYIDQFSISFNIVMHPTVKAPVKKTRKRGGRRK